jgi:hypothetical protein
MRNKRQGACDACEHDRSNVPRRSALDLTFRRQVHDAFLRLDDESDEQRDDPGSAENVEFAGVAACLRRGLHEIS